VQADEIRGLAARHGYAPAPRNVARTGRFDLWQELDLPFKVGPVKVVPFGIIDLTGYTEDLTGSAQGRFYAAGGARATCARNVVPNPHNVNRDGWSGRFPDDESDDELFEDGVRLVLEFVLRLPLLLWRKSGAQS
jgi:hypothetical protein